MKSFHVSIRLRPGETKYAAILRVLGCASLAQAIRTYGLEGMESEAMWLKLESIAATTVASSRLMKKVSRAFKL